MPDEDPRKVERSDQLPEDAPAEQVPDEGGDDPGERSGREQDAPEPEQPATGHPDHSG